MLSQDLCSRLSPAGRACAEASQLRSSRLLEKYLRSRLGRQEATRRFAAVAANLRLAAADTADASL